MALLAVLPALVWLFVGCLFPHWLPALPFSTAQVVSGAIGVFLLLTLFFRQWRWTHWAAWLAGNAGAFYLAEHSDAVNALPIWWVLSSLLLSFAPIPSLRTWAGKGLFILLLGLPLGLLWPPVGAAIAALNPSHWLMTAALRDDYPQLAYGLFVLAIAATWATFLMYQVSAAYRWAQWAAWLVMMALLLTGSASDALSWTVIVAATGLIVALADQLLRLAYIDELTGLPQRRALMSQLQHLKRRSAVCMLDVDHFKKFNDKYGHDVGDQVLRLLGRILAEQKGLKAYRYGGEEFTLVFAHNDQARLKAQLEEVRKAVASYPLSIRDASRPKRGNEGKQQRGQRKVPNKHVKVTISLGATVRAKNDTAEAILKRADENLYSAKKAGRNRVVLR